MYKELASQPPEGSWFDSLGELALACAGSFAGEEALRLRDAYVLLGRAPAHALLAGTKLPDPALFETLVHAGAGESAALALLGSDAGFLLSRGAQGRYLASVILPGRNEEASAGAETAALAIVGALALALQDLALKPGEWGEAADRPALRLN
ncbi:hypothetical protein [Novosphingobium sp. TH158]|uniref:hypothetical protein n=1 Tax=Novosphingobium sp. TH158 TaxID=2067455 RepID=UPI000C7B9400|nr:hypothetical protein [Novosphingobium sp. TH158]PLK26633.1 hypothetical protein C0V78_06850 [Novosphingobium sp. TH158]